MKGVIPESFGEIRGVQQMEGMGGGEVYLVTLAERQVIVKRINHGNEWYFYKNIAPSLRRHALASEHAQLSTSAWTADMNALALSYFRKADLSFMRGALERLRECYQHLFRAEHLISGDCNINNWGVNRSGHPVLYDWERVGSGTAALDLATLVRGFPPRAMIEEFALLYGQQVANRHVALASDIAAAIVWTVVDIFCLHDAGRVQLTPGVIEACRERVPGWVTEVDI